MMKFFIGLVTVLLFISCVYCLSYYGDIIHRYRLNKKRSKKRK